METRSRIDEAGYKTVNEFRRDCYGRRCPFEHRINHLLFSIAILVYTIKK